MSPSFQKFSQVNNASQFSPSSHPKFLRPSWTRGACQQQVKFVAVRLTTSFALPKYAELSGGRGRLRPDSMIDGRSLRRDLKLCPVRLSFSLSSPLRPQNLAQSVVLISPSPHPFVRHWACPPAPARLPDPPMALTHFACRPRAARRPVCRRPPCLAVWSNGIPRFIFV